MKMIVNRNDFILNDIKNVRVLLHENFYTNPLVMEELCNDISSSFNLFTIEYNINTKVIQLKIKKTNMRKIEDGNLVNYYYQILNAIFVQFFIKKYNVISDIMINKKEQYNIRGEEINYLNNINSIYNFYNITLISDNIITIHL